MRILLVEDTEDVGEAIVARLLRDAKLENWDGVIAASEGESEARQVMQKLLASMRRVPSETEIEE